jgi:hypothetical protein
MDLSIFERVFALRDEARKAQLGADAPDLSELSRGTGRGEVADLPSLPQEELAADLMARGAALREQANKVEEKSTRPSRTAIADLLDAASAPLPVFNESDLASDRTAPAAKTEAKAFTRALESRGEMPRPVPAKKDPPRKKKRDGLTTKKKSRDKQRAR